MKPTRLHVSLFLLRIGVFAVMIMWTVDKFVNPDHAAAVFENYYRIPALSGGIFYAIGGAQLLVVLGFVLGAFKRVTYGLVLLMHTVSTVSTYKQFLDPWTSPNLLFFAAIPMLTAIIALYLLRDEDNWLALHNSPAAPMAENDTA